ncbi:outer membrane beta-barrel protein [Hymenobacter sp. IS2118]|uniref:outer membrane beta-barrel protein n=1 Tax=Hymenobacter sp. IS2118 TaxID=1505605 RepID=UPI000B01CEFA|nr:outer membrane beta-barrel protein [Hymenobacter sp. IS2118]
MLLFGGLNVASATSLTTSAPVAKDTIVIRLPNQATITLVVRDAAQLRQMKTYQLDSLTSRLAGYITQAETAAKNATSDQVTVQFYPDKDQPGQNLPEQIRITTHKKTASRSSSNGVVVLLNKKFGLDITTDDDGNTAVKSTKSKARKIAESDSIRLHNIEKDRSNFIFDLGLNALVNQQNGGATGSDASVDLRTGGSRYVNIGFNYETRLGGKRSPVGLLIGPEFAFNNFMLNGNNKWVNADGRTSVVKEIDGREFQKSKLTTASINVPLMLQLKFRDSHHQPTFHVAAGGFVGYRLGAHTKLKYIEDGNTDKEKDAGSYNLENFLYGAQGTIGFGSLEFFGKYNMNDLFKNNAGPKAQVVSFGIRFFGN